MAISISSINLLGTASKRNIGGRDNNVPSANSSVVWAGSHTFGASILTRATPAFTSVAVLSSTTQTIEVSSNVTITFNGNPPANTAYIFSLRVDHQSGSITWPSSVKWSNRIAPALTSGRKHLFTFYSDDAGATWIGASVVNI